MKPIDINERMYKLASKGDIKLVKRLISLTSINMFNAGLYGAASEGNKELVDYFIYLGANNLNEGMRLAAYHNHKDLVDHFIKLGADDTNLAMCGAALGDHIELVKYTIALGADDFDRGLVSGEDNRLIVKYFLKLGADARLIESQHRYY